MGMDFLFACLIAIGIIPIVQSRAIRLTTRRLTAATLPRSVEIQIAKDLLRAEFAASTCALERTIEELRSKTTT
jgi:hypothetical protein